MSPDWDAHTYDRVADPQFRWGTAVVEAMPLRGDERVLDAGCGSGRVTEVLLRRVPQGRVVALDGSAAMLEEARHRLAADTDRIEFVHADLGRPLSIAPVDAVLSTAVFHWVPDHDALFRNLAAVMKPGAALRAQFGGRGNVAALGEAVRRTGIAWEGPWTFPTAEETAERLRQAGFVDVSARLHAEPTTFADHHTLEAFLATVCLRPLLGGVPEDRYSEIVRAVAAELPGGELDYVRLTVEARRG